MREIIRIYFCYFLNTYSCQILHSRIFLMSGLDVINFDGDLPTQDEENSMDVTTNDTKLSCDGGYLILDQHKESLREKLIIQTEGKKRRTLISFI